MLAVVEGHARQCVGFAYRWVPLGDNGVPSLVSHTASRQVAITLRKECWCGVYAFTSAVDCRRHARATEMFAATLMDPSQFMPGVALGQVELSADAFLAKSGPPQSASVEWLASACRITRLYTGNRELAGALAARYHVPVDNSPE